MSEALRLGRVGNPNMLAAQVHRSEGRDRAAVAALVHLALGGDHDAAAALFGGVVEPFCDGFTARGARACEAVLAQVIDLARHAPGARALDAALRDEGIGGEADLLARARWGTGGLPQSEPSPSLGSAPTPGPTPPAPPARRAPWALPSEPRRVRRLIVLSRVTLGADLAVNGVLLPALMGRFPDAEAVLLGPEVARPFAEGLGARIRPVEYGRRRGLAERLSAWAPLREAVRAETAGLAAGEWLLVDPDTRLTQLGLLAPGPEAAYRRLPSREAEGPGALACIARAWLHRAFGIAPAPPSPLPLGPRDAVWSRRLRAALSDGRTLVAMGFGTGGSPAKRVGPRFEAGMALWVLALGHRIVLSRGVDGPERAASAALCAALAASGARVAHLSDGRHLEGVQGADVVTWAADPGAFFATLAACDAHLGYDSAGQHVAAALGVPTLTAFVESAGPLHSARWTPTGAGPVRVARLAPGTPDATALRACRAEMRALLDGARRAPPPAPVTGPDAAPVAERGVALPHDGPTRASDAPGVEGGGVAGREAPGRISGRASGRPPT